MIVQYRKARCDLCGKEAEVRENSGDLPLGWIETKIAKRNGSMGYVVIKQETCSEECALKLIQSIKEIPKVESKIWKSAMFLKNME